MPLNSSSFLYFKLGPLCMETCHSLQQSWGKDQQNCFLPQLQQPLAVCVTNQPWGQLDLHSPRRDPGLQLQLNFGKLMMKTVRTQEA